MDLEQIACGPSFTLARLRGAIIHTPLNTTHGGVPHTHTHMGKAILFTRYVKPMIAMETNAQLLIMSSHGSPQFRSHGKARMAPGMSDILD